MMISTFTLTSATFPFVRRLVKRGWREACKRDAAPLKGLNVVNAKATHAGVAEAFALEYSAPDRLL